MNETVRSQMHFVVEYLETCSPSVISRSVIMRLQFGFMGGSPQSLYVHNEERYNLCFPEAHMKQSGVQHALPKHLAVVVHQRHPSILFGS